jgi:predicted Zn-ribbon and HTH transcriptional regulator
MTRRPLQRRERSETLRQAIQRHLEVGPLTARELSARVHISEKEVIPHLEHLERSLRRSESRLAFDPAECLSCGYRFRGRRRLTRPSACPRCRAQHTAAPVFRLESSD